MGQESQRDRLRAATVGRNRKDAHAREIVEWIPHPSQIQMVALGIMDGTLVPAGWPKDALAAFTKMKKGATPTRVWTEPVKDRLVAAVGCHVSEAMEIATDLRPDLPTDTDGDVHAFEVRAPSAGERFDVLGCLGDDVSLVNLMNLNIEQTRKFYIELLLRFVTVPGETEAIYERADAKSIMAEPVTKGGWVDALMAVAVKLFRGDKAAASGKASATTPRVASSTT